MKGRRRLFRRGKFVVKPGRPDGILLSRRGQLDRPVVASSIDQTISRHGLDHRPVLPEECRGVVNVGRMHFDAASLSSALVRYLKMERVGYRLRVFAGRPAFAAHLVSPLRASNRDTLNSRFGFSCGALVAKLVRCSTGRLAGFAPPADRSTDLPAIGQIKSGPWAAANQPDGQITSDFPKWCQAPK